MLYLFCHFISSIKFTWGIIPFLKYNKADTEGEGGLKRVVRKTSFDGRTQRYHYNTTGQLVLNEDENLVTLWHHDEETELHYNRHRYYDPSQERYITQDPIGLWGGWNHYKYPLDPVEYIDPSGLDVRLVNTDAVGGWHRKVEVDEGTGTYGISFGVYTADPDIWGNISGTPDVGKAGDGMVYVDNDSAIKVAESFKTTPEEDALIKKTFGTAGR
ncbi:RHS repeat-associated core domain-containing protein [Citrobacter sedlakii]